MFDALCTYPLTSDLFAQAIHPTTPLLALGLASGHVQLNRLPPSDPTSAPQPGRSCIETQWRTRRHKGSCRSLSFSHDGEQLLSAGTDGLVKVATTETGRVVGKIAVPLNNSSIDPPILLHTLTPQTLLLATDSSALYLYDLRANTTFANSRPQQKHHPHDDYVTSLTPLPPTDASTSGTSKQWISTGGTTVAVTDLRRGVLVKSEDQGEELLSSTIVNGKLIVGGEKGGLRLWQVGVWDDNEETVMVGKGASADVLAAIPEGVGKEQMLGVGMDDGVVRFLGMGGKRAKVLDWEVRHDDVEGVLELGFEIGGRMCSGGGGVVKVWEESLATTAGGRDEDDQDGEDGEDEVALNGEEVNGFDSDEGDDGEGGVDGSSEEEEKPRKRKKRRRNKGKDHGGNQKVMAFKGID